MDHNDFLISQGKHEKPNAETLGFGYKVLYEDGYVSWSPKSTFEKSYRKLSVKEINI